MAAERTGSNIIIEKDVDVESTKSRRKSKWQSKLGNSLFIIILMDLL